MLLRNYYNWLASLTLGVTNTDTSTFGDGHLNTKKLDSNLSICNNTSSSLRAFALGYSVYTGISTTCDTVAGSIVLGSGNTPVTFEDYTLDSIISSGWTKGTVTVGTPAYNSETKKWTNTISFLCTNTSGAEMTIREVGIITYIYSNTSTSLVLREVLSSPATITNGQSKTITLNLEYTMPTV